MYEVNLDSMPKYTIIIAEIVSNSNNITQNVGIFANDVNLHENLKLDYHEPRIQRLP